MIKYFCDQCGKETMGKYQMDADTYRILCVDCVPVSVTDNEKRQDMTIKPVPGNWTRRAAMEAKHYERDILQPFTRKGHVNEKFVEAYGAGLYAQEMGRKDITEHYLRKGTP